MKLKFGIFIKVMAMALSVCTLMGKVFAIKSVPLEEQIDDGFYQPIIDQFRPKSEIELCEAIRSRDYLKMRSLMARKPEVGEGCETPLNIAVRFGDCQVVSFLVDNGAKIDEPGNNGQYPLHVAALLRKEDIVRYLVEKKANIDVLDASGDTPLHSAIYGESKSILEYLINQGARLDVRNSVGNTPLHCAVVLHNPVFAVDLIDRGANFRLVNEQKRTAMDMATDVFYWNNAVISSLNRRGAAITT